MGLENCMATLVSLYGKDIKTDTSSIDEEQLVLLPEKLQEFYKEFTSLKTPFGKIFALNECIKMSKKEPFKSEGWICFGQDDYFSFWLCKISPNQEGLSFTTWDHEMEEEIDEPTFETISDLLNFLSDEYMDSELATMCSISVSGYCKDAMKEVMAVKKAFHSPISILELKEKASKGSCRIKETFHYYQAKKIIKELDLKYIKVSLKKKSGWY